MAAQQAAAGVEVGETREQIAALSDGELIARYRQGLQQFDSRILEMSDEQLDQAFLPDAGVGQWPVRVLVGHLADAELAFSHRMRRAVSEANPLLAQWDENAFIDAGLYAGGQYPLGGFLAVIHTLRRWTAEWLGTLSVEQLKLRAMHPERGPLSVRDMLVTTTWHLEHHARYLNAKVCRMLGPAPADEGGSCCGSSCGCHKK